MAPDGWEKRTLASLADYHNGRAFKPKDWGKEGLPIIRIAQMTNPIAKTDFYSGDDVEAKHKINNGDMLFSWSATLAVMLWNRGPAVLNQHIFKVEEKSEIYGDFLYHLLNNSIGALAEHSHGSTMKHIKKGVLKDFIVSVPSLHEQKKIAAILCSVDDAIQATQAVIDQTHKVKQGLMQHLLTRGIRHTRFKQTEIGEIPDDWKVSELVELCEKMTNGYVGPTKNIYTEKGIPYILCQNVRPNQFIKKIFKFVNHDFHSNNARSILKKGDVLTVQTGAGNGDTCVISNEFVGANCHALIISRTIKHLLDPYFLSNYLNSPHGKKRIDAIATGMAQPHLNTTDLRKFKIPVPPIEEQREISKNLKAFENSIFENQSYLGDLNKIKRGLMQNLLTGRVRVKLDEMNTT